MAIASERLIGADKAKNMVFVRADKSMKSGTNVLFFDNIPIHRNARKTIRFLMNESRFVSAIGQTS